MYVNALKDGGWKPDLSFSLNFYTYRDSEKKIYTAEDHRRVS